MPFEQRYTPVPGMQPASNRHSQNMGGSSESSGENVYNDPQPLASLPAASRTSYSDPFLSESAEQRPPQPYANRMDSDISTKSVAGAGAPAAQRMSMASTAQPATFHNAQAYQNVPSEQYWDNVNSPARSNGTGTALDQAQERREQKSHRRKGIIVGCVIGFLALAGIVIGVAVSQTRKHNTSDVAGRPQGTGSASNNGNSGSNGGSNTSGNATVVGGVAYTKDSRLHQSFYGFAYTPLGTVPPECGATQENVTAEVWIMSQLTTKLRLYSANCNTTEMVLQAIQDLGVDMTIWPAVYIDSNDTAMTTQLQSLSTALQKFGTAHIEGITIGNEYILDITGASDNSSSGYPAALATLQADIKLANTTVQNLKLDKSIPIGNSDSGSNFGIALGRSVDFFMSNVHPYFAQQPITTAASWTLQFFDNFNVQTAAATPNHPAVYIAETGWPTESDTYKPVPNSGYTQGGLGDASIPHLQTFLDTFVCQANSDGVKYFFFEAFDEPWKGPIYGGVEAHWGIFDSNRNLKDGITIPQC